MEKLQSVCGKRDKVYKMIPVQNDYWAAVTDVDCPLCCGGKVRWAEDDYVPGYRICDHCKQGFLAEGDVKNPVLVSDC